MPDMTSDQIRDIAVRCVEGFFNDKVPLSQGLAKEASAFDMNLEQIKRASEVSNVVCQLKLMQLSEDKTVEFPLCKVAEVMKTLCLPDEVELSKEASVSDFFGPSAPLEKYAGLDVSEHERTLNFIKEAAYNAKALSQLEDRAVIVKAELTKVARQVENDPQWLEKMSSVKSDHFSELSLLVSGTSAKPRDFGDHAMFKEAELKQVKTMAELYKEARAIVAETSKRRDMSKRAEDLSAEMTKEAFLGTAAGMLGKALGKGTGLAGKAAIGVGALGAVGAGRMLGGAFGKGSVTSRVAGAAAMDSIGHLSSGGMGYAKNGAPKDVWEALQS